MRNTVHRLIKLMIYCYTFVRVMVTVLFSVTERVELHSSGMNTGSMEGWKGRERKEKHKKRH